MMDRMPSSLLKKWIEYHRLEPFGQPWENWLMAVPAHMFASVHSKKGAVPPFKDFVYVDPMTEEIEKQKAFIGFLDHYEPREK
jgi:hypothetical protein